ncbi:Gfo/Idh/MocA family protein [Sphingomonas sp. SUN039]|uniref:Gfo/Idh/MocA family protein n=1 Tax=Sphingomonas sp. SUN039 TaxID=2937787 RepID=UPI002164E566|nr:Gfo/Idh/MocA family oxidoreductase [Sphingomonas sp. SUN039]UVO53110.1 Gfo/Idh/MocA family oxidoreductase [Sphingomonas sp. SUN039]
MTPLRVGVLGAGAIAPPYYMAMQAWPQLDLRCCASKGMASAEAAAAKYGIAAVRFDAMLADPEIDVILNLTPVQAHFATSKAILSAGKHLYSEKPLAATLAEAAELIALARAKGLRIGCAPDTFFGSAHQAARSAIDAGSIGTPVGGALFFGNAGVEMWHPKPEPFYSTGGGPVSDHSPYYLSQAINLLGPVASVSAAGARPFPLRTMRNAARAGEVFETQVDTSIAGTLTFANGTLVTLAMSWDVGPHGRAPIEIYGSEGTLHNPDPNWSDGKVTLQTREGKRELDHSGRPFHKPTMINFFGIEVGYYRLCGLADMADAIADNRPHRASADMALHVMDVIEAIRLSGETGQRVDLKTSCERPAPIADDIAGAANIDPFGGMLDARKLF